MLASDQNQAAAAKSQYGQYQGQADAANKQVQDYTNYMATTGSGGNQYNVGLQSQLGQLGYDPAQMTAARGNLNQATGALSAYSDFANTGASKFGLNAGGFAAANAGALGGINNNIAAQQGVVNGLGDLYKTAQTGANQYAGQQVQSEQNTLGGYQAAFTNLASQRDSAQKNMQFYDQLASSQGGLNAQQAASYAAAQSSMAQIQQAMAQVAYLASQTAGQNLQNQANQAQLTSNAAKAQATAQAKSNSEYQNMQGTGTLSNQPAQGGLYNDLANNSIIQHAQQLPIVKSAAGLLGKVF
jgi:hypothetical protein